VGVGRWWEGDVKEVERAGGCLLVDAGGILDENTSGGFTRTRNTDYFVSTVLEIIGF
jgi:hypothetical protein